VAVVAHDRLDVDVLRSLARPGVTLWLETSSNTLRDSTLENVARFDEAWVRLRPPLKAVDALPFRRAPKAGGWAIAADLSSLVGRLPGGRRWAARVEGALSDSLLDVLKKSRPAVTWWQAPSELDVLSFGQLRALPGRKIISLPPGALVPVGCGKAEREPTLEIHVASLLAVNSTVFPCGSGTRVVVTPAVDLWLVQSLLLRDPSVELVLFAPDDETARSVAAFLSRVGVTQRR
jgi:hypothetical protein